MNFVLHAVFSFTVGIGAVIGLVRIKKMDAAYLPFLLMLWLGLAHELLSFLLIQQGFSNAITYNFFLLLEALLITNQFFKWGLFAGRKATYALLQLFFSMLWLAELLYHKGLFVFFSYSSIIYAVFIVWMSINHLCTVMFSEPGPAIFQAKFLVCMGFILYFTYTMLVEMFWMYGLNRSSSFRISIYTLFGYINFLTNLIFAFATLWIPMNRHYIRQSS